MVLHEKGDIVDNVFVEVCGQDLTRDAGTLIAVVTRESLANIVQQCSGHDDDGPLNPLQHCVQRFRQRQLAQLRGGDAGEEGGGDVRAAGEVGVGRKGVDAVVLHPSGQAGEVGQQRLKLGTLQQTREGAAAPRTSSRLWSQLRQRQQ